MLETAKPTKFVSIVDPGLEHVSPETMTEYGLHRRWETIEPFIKRDTPPIVYVTRLIPRSIWTRMIAIQPTEELKAMSCFQYGVIRVENLPTEDAVRLQFAPTGSLPTADGELTYITDAEMNRFFPAEYLEIGGCIYRRNFFRSTTDVIYPPPPMCLDQWGRRAALFAVASPTTPAPNKSEPYSSGSQLSSETGPPNESEGKK